MALPRALHDGVDVAVDHHLNVLAPPAASVPPTEVATINQRPGMPVRGDDHRRNRRDEQQLDDPGLGERDVAPKTSLTNGGGGGDCHGEILTSTRDYLFCMG